MTVLFLVGLGRFKHPISVFCCSQMEIEVNNLFWSEAGPLVKYDGDFIYIEDLNPHIETKWRMSRWEMFVFGIKAIKSSLVS